MGPGPSQVAASHQYPGTRTCTSGSCPHTAPYLFQANLIIVVNLQAILDILDGPLHLPNGKVQGRQGEEEGGGRWVELGHATMFGCKEKMRVVVVVGLMSVGGGRGSMRAHDDGAEGKTSLPPQIQGSHP